MARALQLTTRQVQAMPGFSQSLIASQTNPFRIRGILESLTSFPMDRNQFEESTG